MEYDPVKDRLEALITRMPLLRRLLFLVLRQVFLREMEVRRQLRALKAGGLKPARILDAGTGFGQYTLFLRQLFPEAEILSVDIKQDYLDAMEGFCRAEAITGVEFAFQDLLELEAEDRYDLILNVDVMEHIRDDVRVFANFRRALRPGGVLVLHTPAVPESRPQEDVEFREGTYSVGEHVREGYKPSMMEERLARVGFGQVSLKPTYGFWGGIAWRLLVRWPMAALSASFLLAPLVAIWMLLAFIPARLCNALELRLAKATGGCMLVTARP
ncbi:MAG: class I SAM-dependent methyltransferase [Calditrichaeota bacterium]|nr:class I SAM-dependent methyltransferase [Candidatus Cloacimonadota bacterium]MCB1046823.1 class I SAM-dependent methyltransferase [Calditrichota bacterium]MCB9473510.1 class I SAM-dependent methyltransferase [Candidatus Delongbacteria bacterium]